MRMSTIWVFLILNFVSNLFPAANITQNIQAKDETNTSKINEINGIKSAIKCNNISSIKSLINLDNVNDLYDENMGITYLLAALWNYRFEIAKILIDIGADVNKASFNKETPLMIAVNTENLDIINLILHRGANINAIDDKGRTAILRSIRLDGSYKIIKLLLDEDADFNLADENGEKPIDIALTESLKNCRYFGGIDPKGNAKEIFVLLNKEPERRKASHLHRQAIVSEFKKIIFPKELTLLVLSYLPSELKDYIEMLENAS